MRFVARMISTQVEYYRLMSVVQLNTTTVGGLICSHVQSKCQKMALDTISCSFLGAKHRDLNIWSMTILQCSTNAGL